MKRTPLLTLGFALCTLNLSAQDSANPNPLNTCFDGSMRTPLMAAAQMSQADKVKELLAQGADPNAANPRGVTPLMLASWDMSGESARLLLEAGADPHAKSKMDVELNALDYAAMQGNLTVAKMLLAAGVKPISATIDKVSRYNNCLLDAAADGNKEMVDLLLANGAQAAPRDFLLCAAGGGLYDILADALQKNPKLAHVQTEYHKTLLMAAAEGGNPDCVRLLLKAGVAPDDEEFMNKTALAFAAEKGHAEAVRLLLDAGAKNRPPFSNALSPMQVAVREGKTEVVEIFLEKGVDINDCQPGFADSKAAVTTTASSTDTTYLGIAGLTPLLTGYNDSAIMNSVVYNRGRTDMIEFLLSKEADVELANGDGTTPLMAATQHGYAPQARVLLAAGAKADARDKMGNTALLYAAKAGCAELVRDLLAAGADANAANDEGMTPLLYAALANAPECVALLKEAGANADAKDKAGHCVAQLAAFGGNKSCLEAALATGTGVDTRDASGHTLLAYAVLGGQPELVTLLLEKGADINAKDAEGMTPLMYATLREKASVPRIYSAVRRSSTDLVALLLDRGADAKAADNDGATALHYAVLAQATPERLGKLIAAGADVNAKDKDGHDALTLACYFGMQKNAETLLAAGADPNTRDREGTSLLENSLLKGNMLNQPVIKPDRLLVLGITIAKHQSQPALLKGAPLYRGDFAYTEKLVLPINGNKIAGLLLDKGADPFITNKDGKSLLKAYMTTFYYDARRAVYTILERINTLPDGLSSEEKAGLLIWTISQKEWFHSSEPSDKHPMPNPVEKLLQLGCDPNGVDEDGNTPLTAAAVNDNFLAAKALLEHGADVNKANAADWTPLHCSARFGSVTEGHMVLRLLLAQPGIDIEAKDNNGDTPLLEASRWAHESAINILLEAGADINATDNFGTNILMTACGNIKHKTVFETLYKTGKIDPKATNDSGYMDTLFYAVVCNRQDIIDTLLPEGVTDEIAQGGHSPELFVNALLGRCIPVARGLMEHGLDVLAIPADKQGLTPLHKAAGSCPELVPDLLAKGLDPKATTPHGMTALMYAVIHGVPRDKVRLDTIRSLIEAGCDPNAKDETGSTALDHARRLGHKEQVELLQQYMQGN